MVPVNLAAARLEKLMKVTTTTRTADQIERRVIVGCDQHER